MKKVFHHTGRDFSAVNAAMSWLQKNGFSFGSMCRHDPIGILYGDAVIAKWRNLSLYDTLSLHGKITTNGDGYRNSDVTVEIVDYIAALAGG